MIDKYTKAFLTVIAATLIALVWQQASITWQQQQLKQEVRLVGAIESVRHAIDEIQLEMKHPPCGESTINPCYIAIHDGVDGSVKYAWVLDDRNPPMTTQPTQNGGG
jgi:hypothetical protein